MVRARQAVITEPFKAGVREVEISRPRREPDPHRGRIPPPRARAPNSRCTPGSTSGSSTQTCRTGSSRSAPATSAAGRVLKVGQGLPRRFQGRRPRELSRESRVGGTAHRRARDAAAPASYLFGNGSARVQVPAGGCSARRALAGLELPLRARGTSVAGKASKPGREAHRTTSSSCTPWGSCTSVKKSSVGLSFRRRGPEPHRQLQPTTSFGVPRPGRAFYFKTTASL